MAKDPPIYTWGFESSKPRAGRIVTYLTQIQGSGVLSCDCPGWTIKKKDKPRQCRHTKSVESEVAGIIKRFNNGEDLGGITGDIVTSKSTETLAFRTPAAGFKRKLKL